MKKLLSRFWNDEAGVITVETVIAVPFVALAFGATYVFFDVYRVSTAGQKAAYTVADTISRQTDPVDEDFIVGLNTLHDILARTRNATGIRVSSIGWSNQQNRYVAIWSVSTSMTPALTNDLLTPGLTASFPDIPQGETFLFVETSVDYTPLFRVGIAPQTFRQAVVTRPRFAPQVAFDDGTDILSQDFGAPTCDDGDTLCNPGNS
jgi:Flp pilus assembly pilin Flp